MSHTPIDPRAVVALRKRILRHLADIAAAGDDAPEYDIDDVTLDELAARLLADES